MSDPTVERGVFTTFWRTAWRDAVLAAPARGNTPAQNGAERPAPRLAPDSRYRTGALGKSKPAL